MTWIWILLALFYVLLSMDLLPDMLGVWGWLDDLLVLYLLYRYLRRKLRSADPSTGPRQEDQQGTEAPPQSGPKDPYEVLEIPRGASSEEIRSAYRRLAAQYHPDKVAYLGKEFREMAEHRFKEIQQAYDQLRGKR